ncbi:MAG: EAL domain-containing protein [Clostridia bacterium]|nr:EAL domain-containing protein [Clostridia bacterium]
MLQVDLFDNYNIAGDVGVIAICAVIVILLSTAYVVRTRSFHVFLNVIASLTVAALVNILYHFLLAKGDSSPVALIYVLRVVYQMLLLDVLFLFALYTTQASGMEHKKARAVAIIAVTLFTVTVGIDVILSLTGTGFRIAEDGTVTGRSNVFVIGYILFIALLAILMTQIRHLVYKRILYGFYGTMIVSVAIRFIQLALNQSSLTTMTFVFPTIAMLYIMHSNPYSVTLGTVDIRAMEEMVRNMYGKKSEFVFLSLLLPDFDEEGKEFPEELSRLARKFSAKYFKKGVLFQLSNGHVVLVAPKQYNPDYEKRIERILANFEEQYQRLHLPYKIVVGESNDEISRRNEYASLIKSVVNSQPENTVCRVSSENIERYNREEYILRELTDIFKKCDVDDPRVLAFCQPVFNLKAFKFDTAEALMRLDLERTGIVYPDEFIPLAESHGFIHVLTEIILNKTCREIRKLIEEGYSIERISVNVSALELKDKDFCEDITKIIDGNSISGDKIAIELTESSSEADFMIMKEKVEELRDKGIQFYLDDFGTGYSNMQKIMELPFDIIKFDRSLVIASGTGDRAGRIVENLAHIFKDMEYSILYEGVETDVDEKRCQDMSASYLQGYKYSRPVPIEQLREFLQKAE